MPKRPERPRRSIRGRPRPSRESRDGLESRSSGPSSEFDEVPQDEHTTWHPSLEGMDPGELTKWISGKSDQPDFERTDSRGVRRAPPSPDFNEFDQHEATGIIHTPKKRPPEPERQPRRRTKRRMKKSLPTPEPAPRRRTRKEAAESGPIPHPKAPRPTPRPPRPPTPEPAPPRRSRRHEARKADQEPSLTVPRVGRTPAPPPQRRRSVPSVGRTPSPRHPSSAPDHWTPAPAQRAFQNDEVTQDNPPEYPGFEEAHDVPATVVSEDSVDEVPPSAPLPHIPNDAPTIVRPDLAMLEEAVEPGPSFEEAPAGEPTVALPAPSKRKNTQVRQPTPEPAPDALPSGASYTPPPETPERKAKTKTRDTKKSSATPKPKSRSKSKSKSKTPSRSKKGSDEPKRKRKSRSKKQNWDLDDEQKGGVPMMWVVYGSVVLLGGLLVLGAFIAGIIILVVSSS